MTSSVIFSFPEKKISEVLKTSEVSIQRKRWEPEKKPDRFEICDFDE